MKCYIVTAPDEVRGIYETWDECKAAVAGRQGARYRKVESREKAETCFLLLKAMTVQEIRRKTPRLQTNAQGRALRPAPNTPTTV